MTARWTNKIFIRLFFLSSLFFFWETELLRSDKSDFLFLSVSRTTSLVYTCVCFSHHLCRGTFVQHLAVRQRVRRGKIITTSSGAQLRSSRFQPGNLAVWSAPVFPLQIRIWKIEMPDNEAKVKSPFCDICCCCEPYRVITSPFPVASERVITCCCWVSPRK